MLTERARQLITAYVDGILPAAEREEVRRLVTGSAEAKALFDSVRSNAQTLKALPRKTLSQSFPDQVVAALPALPSNGQAPEPFDLDGDITSLVRQPPVKGGLPAWAVGGIAVALVAVIVLGGMAWVRSQLDYDPNLLPRDRVQPPLVHYQPVQAAPPGDDAVNKLIDQMIHGAGQRYVETRPEPQQPAPKNSVPRFAFGDLLAKQDSRDMLTWELTNAGGNVHLDVSVKYNARSLNRLIDAFHKQGVNLVVTPPASASLAKNQPLLVYCENVPADKLALALKDLGEVDVTGNKREPSTYEAVRVAPGSADDVQRAAGVLGIDPRQLKSPPMPLPQVNGLGVVLPVERPENPAAVREIQDFLAARGPVHIGTLQVFLHLQPTAK